MKLSLIGMFCMLKGKISCMMKYSRFKVFGSWYIPRAPKQCHEDDAY